ncbi:Cobalamin biosynthesis protein CobD [Ferriphaselus amnicola]|uniref:Cobalamin biosynthesis protein CobD n=1 Tax=Ferriphaselus amnicola TaxID=1188319 RepID=A0A2Z6GBH6_9PROT|nr:adenosylcobinamide-phosphate synthase CbiB [Ferriphaselus amnicola]BBE50848.1 Cobalamin biosynthesis protein CobD [Ferriphaselus amnicola]
MMDLLCAYSLPLLVLAAVLLDQLLGEPRRFHPLVGLGNFARRVEDLCYPSHTKSASRLYSQGMAAVCLVIAPFVLLAVWLQTLQVVGVFFPIVVLYFCIAPRSLREHAERVWLALQARELVAARTAVSMMVSRDTTQLDERAVAKATVESVLENGNDAIFAALFWFVVAGAPGVVLYRISNTLDAMWGYRNARYQYFGWAAARLDDWLNFIPARLTALSYALLGKTSSALRCWRTQAPLWDSPNAGPVMAAGAGALQVQLGGAARYCGVEETRPLLGGGEAVGAADIRRACALVQRVLWVWLGLIFVASSVWEVAHA